MSNLLFLREDGNPIHFKVIPHHGADIIKKQLTSWGGECIPFMSPEEDYAIRMMAPGMTVPLQRTSDVFSTTFITDCVNAKQLLDLSTYRLNSNPVAMAADTVEVMMGNMTWKEAVQRKQNSESTAGDKKWISSREGRPSKPTAAVKPSGGSYTFLEKKSIVEYIIKSDYYQYVKGNSIWKEMEKAEVCKGRSWQSLRSHFLNFIIHEIGSFKLEKDVVSKFQLGIEKGSCIVDSTSKNNRSHKESCQEMNEEMVEDIDGCGKSTTAATNTSEESSDDRQEEPCNNIASPTKRHSDDSDVSVIARNNQSSPTVSSRHEEPTPSTSFEQDGSAQGTPSSVAARESDEGMGLLRQTLKRLHREEREREYQEKMKELLKEVPLTLEQQFQAGLITERPKTLESPVEKNSKSRRKQPYSMEEKQRILDFISHNNCYWSVKGNNIWKQMEDIRLCKGRTWQSMKEHFIKAIIPNIKSFPLKPKIVRKFLAGFRQEAILVSDSDTEDNVIETVQNDNEGSEEADSSRSSDRLRSGISRKSFCSPESVSNIHGSPSKHSPNKRITQATSDKYNFEASRDTHSPLRPYNRSPNKASAESKRDEKRITLVSSFGRASPPNLAPSPERRTNQRTDKHTGRGDRPSSPKKRGHCEERSSFTDCHWKKNKLKKLLVSENDRKLPKSGSSKLASNVEDISHGESSSKQQKDGRHILNKTTESGVAKRSPRKLGLHKTPEKIQKTKFKKGRRLAEPVMESLSQDRYLPGNSGKIPAQGARGYRSNLNYYTKDEDQAILNYIIDQNAYRRVGGRQFWEQFEVKKVVPGRSWQSMKQRFRSVLIKRLDDFSVTESQKRKFYDAVPSWIQNR